MPFEVTKHWNIRQHTCWCLYIHLRPSWAAIGTTLVISNQPSIPFFTNTHTHKHTWAWVCQMAGHHSFEGFLPWTCFHPSQAQWNVGDTPSNMATVPPPQYQYLTIWTDVCVCNGSFNVVFVGIFSIARKIRWFIHRWIELIIFKLALKVDSCSCSFNHTRVRSCPAPKVSWKSFIKTLNFLCVTINIG